MQKYNYKSLLNANLDKKFIQRTIDPYGSRLYKHYGTEKTEFTHRRKKQTNYTQPQSVVTRQIDDIVFPTVQEFKTNPLIRLKTGVNTRLRQMDDQSAYNRAIKNNNYVRVPKQFMEKRMDFGRWLSNSSYVNKLRNK